MHLLLRYPVLSVGLEDWLVCSPDSMGTLRQTGMILIAVSVRMDCGWRSHPLLSAIDFRDKSKREEQFSCPQSEQIALSVDASAADSHIWSFYSNGAIFFLM